MKNLLAILLFSFFLPVLSIAQNIPEIKGWDNGTLEMAHSAKDAAYLTDDEKLVIFYTNLARINPQLFAETLLKEHVAKYNTPKNKYLTTLYQDLKKAKPMAILYPKQDVFESAKIHAVTSGKNGQIGHQNFAARTKNLVRKYNGVAENCEYGTPDPIKAVINLLIDEGVPDYGHRKNILNPSFRYTGASIQPHKRFRYNVVINYAGAESNFTSN
jgi:uncharacterized protein YkwD